MLRFRLVGLIAASLILAACDAADAPGALDREFRVAYVSPPDGFVLQEQPTTILFVFSSPIDRDTVSDRTIRLVTQNGVEVRGKRRVRPLTPTTVDFLPADSLVRGRSYYAIASIDLRDSSGRFLHEAHTSVLSVSAPRTTNPAPAPGGGPTVVCPNPLARTVYFKRGTGAGPKFLAIDSESGTELSGPPAGGMVPSYRLHVCRRWFGGWFWDHSTKTPDKESARGVHLVSESGETVVLVQPDANRSVVKDDYPLRWAKDDSFFSFLVIDWANGTPTSHIVRIPLAWSNGTPSVSMKEEQILDSPLIGASNHKPEITTFDWSPSGLQLAYSMYSTAHQRDRIYIYDVATDTSRYLTMGIWPAWSSVGSDDTAPIAFFDGQLKGPGTFTVLPDGTAETLVTPPWTKAPGQQRRESAMWSPDGTRLALIRTEQDLAYQQARTWSVEVLDLVTGDLNELTNVAHEHKDLLLGWR